MSDYEKLGLKDGASKDEIQRAYKVKLLKYQQIQEKTESDKEAFKEIDAAYDRLCGYDVEFDDEPDSKFKDFIYYNKEKIFIIAFVVILVVVFVAQISTRVEYDVSIALIGDMQMVDEREYVGKELVDDVTVFVKQNVLVNEPLVNYFQRGKTVIQDQKYISMQQALTTKLNFGELDLLIMDEENYKEFAENGYLADLSDMLSNYTKTIPDEFLLKSEKGILGVEITGNRYFEQFGLKYKEGLIACICVTSTQKEIAFSVIDVFTDGFTLLPKEVEIAA